MIDAQGLITAVADHASRLGKFERVNMHEPKNAPGNGLTVAIWSQEIGPVPAGSGLSSTTARIAVFVRVMQPMVAEPQDMIDPNLVSAVDALMTAYSGDFDLGGRIRNVDLLGQAGVPLSAQAGYLEQDRKQYRVMTITVPLIVNDVWEQVP
jgi:hypothetical protein